jgi:hypothetical protein
MQTVIELVLQMPGELGMLKVASMNGKYVGMNRHRQVLEIDQNFDNTFVFARRKGEQRMFVKV